jgi:hypothetical protein
MITVRILRAALSEAVRDDLERSDADLQATDPVPIRGRVRVRIRGDGRRVEASLTFLSEGAHRSGGNRPLVARVGSVDCWAGSAGAMMDGDLA